MFRFLKQPYPCNTDARYHIKTGAYVSLFIVFFLVVFKPFGLGDLDVPNKNFLIAGYGIACFVMMLIVFFVLRSFQSPHINEETWTTGKEIIQILIYIFFIGIGNLVYTHFVFGMELTFRSLISFQFITLLVSIFPITVLVLVNQVRLMKKNSLQAEQINKEITISIPQQFPNHIHLIAENEKDYIELDGESLLLIEAADNYSTVYYTEQGNLKNRMIRSSLKRIESQISNPNIIRCHRTYIVNLLRVKSVTGNAQGYRLRFDYFDQSIPVSRNLNDTIKSRLSHTPKH